MKPRPLEPRQLRFVAEYLVDLNACQAAIRAGYSPRTANVQGPRLLSNARIFAAVVAGKERQLAHADLSAVRVLEELRRLAFLDVADLFDGRGNVLPIRQMPVEARAAIAGVEVILKNAKAGDGIVDEVLKLKLTSKVQALEMLAKHFKLLTEVIEVQDADKLVARLAAARRRTS